MNALATYITMFIYREEESLNMKCSSSNGCFITTLFILLPCAIILLFLPSTVDADEYDYSLENTIEGIRDYRTFFVSPDGTKVCIVSSISASIYDVSTGNLLVERQFKDLTIRDGCWIGDEIIIATDVSRDGLSHPDPIVVLSPSDLATIGEHSPTTHYLYYLKPSPTGQYIAASFQSVFYVFDTVNYESIYESDVHTYSIRTFAWDDGEGRIVTAGRQIYIHDISEKTTQKISQNEGNTEMLFWAKGDTRIYSLDGEVMAYYNASSGELEFEDEISSRIDGADVNPSKNDLCFGHGYDWIILSLDTLEQKKEVQDAAGLIQKIVWNWDTYRLLTMSKDGVLRIYRDANDPSYNSPPVVTIIRPTEGEIIADDFVAEGTMTDDKRVLFGFYRLNDQAWLIIENTSNWTQTIESTDMVEGTNTLSLKASDGDRETVELVMFIFRPVVSNDPPRLDILSPTNGTEVRSLVEISGTSSDDREVTIVHVRIDDSGWYVAAGTESWTLTLILEDQISDWHTIEAKASDGELESEIDSVEVFLNTTMPPSNERPTITVESPTPQESVQFDVLCKGSSHDDGSIVRTLLSLDGNSWTLFSTEEEWEETIDLRELEEGSHIIRFIAFDTILSSDVVEVQIEKLPYTRPSVIIGEPMNNHPFSSTVQYEGRVEDGHGEDILVELKVGDGEWTVIAQSRDWTYEFIPTGLDFGNLTLQFRAGDTHSLSTIVDHVCVYYRVPEVTIEHPRPLQRVVGDVRLNGTVDFGFGDIQFLEFRVDGGEWMFVNQSRTWEIIVESSELPIGNVTFEVRANDGLVYSEPASLSIVHDVKRVNEPDVPNYLIVAVIIIVLLLVASIYIVKRYRQ